MANIKLRCFHWYCMGVTNVYFVRATSLWFLKKAIKDHSRAKKEQVTYKDQTAFFGAEDFGIK